MCQRLWIMGAGGHGRVVAEIAKATQQYHEIFFIDDKYANQIILDIPCIAKFTEIDKIASSEDHFIVAIGDNQIRMNLIAQIRAKNDYLTSLVHPSAVISPSANIASGCVVCANAVVQSCASIEVGCIVNTSSVVEHDVQLEKGVHLSPQTCLTGGVSIGENSWIGANATIINGHRVGSHCILGAGSVLRTDMPNYTLFAGVPAVYKKSFDASPTLQ